MNNNEELIRKWQLKKIATLAFINDECDDMKPKDRNAFYSMMEAIFGEIVGDIKNLTLAAVSKCEDFERKALLIDFCEVYAKGGWEDADDTEGIVNWYLRVKDN